MDFSALRALVATCLLVALTTACGQKGPLFLPGEGPESEAEAASSSEADAPRPATVDEAG